MMVVLVIGFNAATRTEQMAARNYSYQEQANQMAMMAVNQAVSILNTNLTNWSARTQPGRLMSQASGPVPLTSAAVPGVSGNRVNVNAWVDTNYFIARTTDRDAFSAPLFEVTRGTNRIGGYAFWVDDDGSRINLNAASALARSNFLPTNARPLVLSRDLFPSVAANHWNSISNGFKAVIDPPNLTATTNGWGYFFTPRQMVGISNVGAANYGAMMFQVGSGPPNWRPTNSYALGSNGVPAVLDTAAGFLATYGSSGYADSLNTLTTALDTVSDSFFRGPNYQSYFGAPNGFAAKYGTDILRQIIVNINDAVLPASDDYFTGATADDMLVSTNSSGADNPVPRAVFGNRPTPYLNEVAVAVVQATNFPGGAGGPAEAQIWMQCELVDPYNTGEGNGWQIKYKVGSLRFSGTYMDTNGNTVQFNNPPESETWNWDGGDRQVTNTVQLSPSSYVVPAQAFAFEWQVGALIPTNASNVVFTSIEVQPVLTLLRKNSDARTVRDWAFGLDFPVGTFLFPNPPTVPVGLGFNGYGPRVLPGGVTFGQSIAKNDPRVRRFADYNPPSPAWIASPSTLGAPNSTVNFAAGTGVSGVANDSPGTAGSDIFGHPSFSGSATNYALGRSNWISAFDLSRVHTGLQWRTLQFRAQAQAESAAGHVPDWALLEAFRVTNTIASPPRSFKLNINALPYPAAGSMTAAELATAGLSRAGAAGSMLSGMTAANAPLASIGTNNLGFPAAAGFANSAAAMLVGSNIANMTFTNTWTTRRSGNTNYQANLYTLPAEVLEVNGVSNFSTDEAANEARAQGVYSGIAVSSQIFTVYAAGFANDKQGTEVAEARLRAQVARDTNSGLFKVIFLEPLIWP